MDEMETIIGKEGERGFWRGRLEGGPLDGSEFALEMPPFVGGRGFQMTVCLGDDVESSDWHVYGPARSQMNAARTGLEMVLPHDGVLPGEPRWPRLEGQDGP